MDNPSTTPSQSRDTDATPPIRSYGSHGPWPVVLDAFLFLKLAWCAKLYYSLLRGDLIGTPAQRMHTSILLNIGVTFVEILSYPGMHLLSRLRDWPWPHNPFFFFTQGFAWAMNDSAVCIMTFMYLHRLPRVIPPSNPGYDPAAARDYRGWRSVDIPLFAMLNMFCAVLIVVDCATWLHWDFERKRRAHRDTELRDLRMRRMFGRQEVDSDHEEMVTGVVVHAGNEGSKGAEAAT